MSCRFHTRTIHQRYLAFTKLRSSTSSARERWCRKQSVTCLATAAGEQLSLHIGETTVALPLSQAAAKELEASVASLLQTFAAKQQAPRPKRWESMEYKLKNDVSEGGLQLFEVFCNPNAYSSAFDAKVLITIKGKDGIHVTTEGRLSNFKADLESYLSQ